MIDVEHWLEATEKSFEGMVDAYFDVKLMPKESFAHDNSTAVGAMIGLVSEANSVQIILLCSTRGSEVLSKALLGYEADEEIAIADQADALAEIVNVVAGMVKTEVDEKDNGLNLTLPTVLTGYCEPIGGLMVTDKTIVIASVEAKVLIVSKQESVARNPKVSAASTQSSATIRS